MIKKITSEDVTLIVRVVWEKLTRDDIDIVFGPDKAKEFISGTYPFVKLWYYATAIQQEDLLEIMNWYIKNQSIRVSRKEQL